MPHHHNIQTVWIKKESGVQISLDPYPLVSDCDCVESSSAIFVIINLLSRLFLWWRIFALLFFVRGSIIQKYMQKSVLYGKEFDGKLLRYKIPTMFLLIPQQPTLNCVFFVFLFILNFVCVCHWRNWLKPVVVNCAFRITFIADERFQAYFKDTTKEWILQIKYVQARDAGVYECQVSTEPKVSARAELHVVGEYSKIYDWKIHCEWIQSFHYLDIFDCCLCLG